MQKKKEKPDVFGCAGLLGEPIVNVPEVGMTLKRKLSCVDNLPQDVSDKRYKGNTSGSASSYECRLDGFVPYEARRDGLAVSADGLRSFATSSDLSGLLKKKASCVLQPVFEKQRKTCDENLSHHVRAHGVNAILDDVSCTQEDSVTVCAGTSGDFSERKSMSVQDQVGQCWRYPFFGMLYLSFSGYYLCC